MGSKIRKTIIKNRLPSRKSGLTYALKCNKMVYRKVEKMKDARTKYFGAEDMLSDFCSLRNRMVNNYCNDREIDEALKVIDARLQDYRRAMQQGFEIAKKGE